jgi:hypothetical protein
VCVSSFSLWRCRRKNKSLIQRRLNLYGRTL